MNEDGPNCPSCGYNLTGLPRDICPECGTSFDLDLLRSDPELRRLGTPVYGKRGAELIPRTIQTLLLLLFCPRSFALRLRVDEPVGPAVAVFLIAISYNLSIVLGPASWTAWRWKLRYGWQSAVFFVAASGLLVLAVAILFAAGSTRGESRVWTFRRRFRFWCIVAMYTMVFAPLWPYFCAGTRSLSWRYYTTYWPLLDLYHRSEAYAATIVILWWTLIISVVLWYRSRPRWLAIILMLAAFLFVRASVQIVDVCIPRLSR